jgi:adhesin/invasin
LPRVGLVGAAALFVAAMACDKSPLVAPSGTAITLISSTNVLQTNGSADITAILIEGAQGAAAQNGNSATTAGGGTAVHNGTLVSFSTTLGRVEPAQARTTDGRVVVKLVGDGRSGTATVTAYSGAATKTLAVAVGSAGAARVVVTATPQSLPATGGTATISAQVQEQQGNGLAGVTVSFSTTAGTLGLGSALTNSSGAASTTLTTGAAATVTASAAGATATLSGTVQITIQPRTTITLTPPSSATVSVPASFSVGVGTATVVTNVVLDFGDGSSASLGAISSTTSVVHLFADSGAKTITATATDADGGKTSISNQLVVAPLSATGAASPTSVSLGTSISFTVTPSSGAVIDHYEFDFGDGTVTSTPGTSLNHIFAATGTKTVTVKVVPVAGKAFNVLIQCTVS